MVVVALSVESLGCHGGGKAESGPPSAEVATPSSAPAASETKAPGAPEFLNASNIPAFLELLPADSVAVVEFMDPHCAACNAVKPAFLSLTTQYASKLRVYQVDITKSPQLAAEYGINFTPTFLAFDPGAKPKDRELVTSETHLAYLFQKWSAPPESPTPEPTP